MNDRKKKATDEVLMQRAGTGDKSAFETLVHRHQRPVINFIFRFLQDPSEAEDLAQEVFLSIWKTAEAYKPDAKFTTWLYRIAVDEGIDAKTPEDRLIQSEQETKIKQAWMPCPRISVWTSS